MPWTDPVEESKLDHLLRLWRVFKAFFLFDTKSLVDLSEWRGERTNLSLNIALFVVAATAMTYGSSRFYIDSQTSADFLNWSIGTAIFFAVMISVPLLIGYRLLKLQRARFAFNVLMIQQTLLAAGVIFSSMILLSQEPARTDFSLLADGRGDGTLAHRRFCGDLEVAAEMVELNQRVFNRSRATLRGMQRTVSWGDPEKASISEAFSRMPVIVSGIGRARRQLNLTFVDMERVRQLNRERERVVSEFYDVYPTYTYAQDFFLAWLIIFVSLSIFHLYRGASLGDKGDKQGAILAPILALSIAGGFVWWTASTGELYLYRDVLVELFGDELPDADVESYDEFVRQVGLYQEIIERAREDIEEQRNDVRAEFYNMSRTCPRANTRGLL